MLRSWVFASCTVQILEVHVTALYKRKSFVCLTLFLTLLYGAYYLINGTGTVQSTIAMSRNQYL